MSTVLRTEMKVFRNFCQRKSEPKVILNHVQFCFLFISLFYRYISFLRFFVRIDLFIWMPISVRIDDDERSMMTRAHTKDEIQC